MKNFPVVVLLIILGLFILLKANQSTKQQAPIVDNSATSDNQLVTSSNIPAPPYDPIQKWGEQKVASSERVMAIVKQDCRIFEEGSHLVVEMRMYISDLNKRLGYVRAIADADIILHGKPRNIYFYDPSNKQIAQADTLNGVRLIN